MTKVRFAPSPTGLLHVGNIRTALVNWLFARQQGGAFLLRIDDTDAGRSRGEYVAAIREDLRWLGLQWDEEARQSQRMERYAAAADKLRAQGRLYACYETPEELEMQRRMLASRGRPPIYNRAGRALTEAQKADYEAGGRKAHYRFLLDESEAAWDDLIRGATRFQAAHLSDPVLLREDGVPVYTLASVVDDGELGITHVIRGEDHVSNTAVQIQLFRALGFEPPRFAHMALLKTKEGGMSKREGGSDIRSLREAGILPMAINSLLAKLGTSDAVRPCLDVMELAQGLDFGKFGRAAVQYDPAELAALSEQLLRRLPLSDVQAALDIEDEALWHSVRPNVGSLEEAREWLAILRGELATGAAGEDAQFLRDAAGHLPPAPWSEATYDQWIAALKPASGRSGKALFLPLRRALTGREHGPELKKLLPLLGREKVIERLSA